MGQLTCRANDPPTIRQALSLFIGVGHRDFGVDICKSDVLEIDVYMVGGGGPLLFEVAIDCRRRLLCHVLFEKRTIVVRLCVIFR